MEGNGGMLPNLGSGMLGLEMPLHPHSNPNSNSNSHSHPSQYQHPHPQMLAFASPDTNRSKQAGAVGGYPFKGKQPKQQLGLGLSDEEETEVTGEDGRGRMARWQRVKWTDNMIRLLIMVVYYIGDDCGSEGGEQAGKKRPGAVMQKKGKWKSVSKAMMEKSFYVSPQQCEDKFNDLNKRYKRVNDILGKGTACRVVENQSLLDSMDHFSPKMKEEVRKLLNSKHLFFKEMCAYHHSGVAGGAGCHQSQEVAAEVAHSHQQHHHQHPQQQKQLCFHSPDGGHTNNSRNGMVSGGMHEEEDEDEDEINEEDDDDEDEDDDSDEDDDDVQNVGGNGKCFDDHSDGREDGDTKHKFSSNKRQKFMFSPSSSMSPMMQQLSCELVSVLQDETKSPWERRQWMRSRSMQLQEQQVSFQFKAFELEKQRIKWAKYSSKKEREMERTKLTNERSRLENERMVLILRQKELELIDPHRQQRPSNKIPDLSG